MSPQAVKLPYLNRIKNSRKKGEFFYYYRRAGQNFRIYGEVGSSAWHDNYQQIHRSFEEAERAPEKRLPEDNFGEVVKAYKASRRFQRIKPKTKANYEVELRRLLKAFGDVSIRDINARHISKLRDRVAKEKSGRAAKEMMKVVRLVFKAAVELAIITHNPAAGVDDPVDYKAVPWRHWEQEEIDLFLAHAAPRWRRAVMVLLYTGLRVDDAINVRLTNVKDNVLRWKTAKTGVEVVIPLHSKLLAELSRPMEIGSLYLIQSVTGKRIELVTSVNHGIVREFKRLGIDKPPPVHGLRKNAVMRLLEAGCEIGEIHAITGQSREMIQHYGQKYSRERAAKAAIVKLELADRGK